MPREPPPQTYQPFIASPRPNLEAADLSEALGQQGPSVSPPRRLQLGLPEPQGPPKRPQASVQQLPPAPRHHGSRCPPPLHPAPPGSETWGQPRQAGTRPGLIRAGLAHGPRKQLGAGHPPRHRPRRWVGEASCCSRPGKPHGEAPAARSAPTAKCRASEASDPSSDSSPHPPSLSLGPGVPACPSRDSVTLPP